MAGPSLAQASLNPHAVRPQEKPEAPGSV